jgi:transcriptional regulator with XRE-family HTH domain
MGITGAQLCAARELIGLSQTALAVIVQCGADRIASFEAGESSFDPRILAGLRQALEAAGVEFIDGEPCVRLKSPSGLTRTTLDPPPST